MRDKNKTGKHYHILEMLSLNLYLFIYIIQTIFKNRRLGDSRVNFSLLLSDGTTHQSKAGVRVLGDAGGDHRVECQVQIPARRRVEATPRQRADSASSAAPAQWRTVTPWRRATQPHGEQQPHGVQNTIPWSSASQ